jgi:glycine C-acetyltransferase
MHPFYSNLNNQINNLKSEGLLKPERVITSPQRADISLINNSDKIINLCANNYLGLADHPELIKAAQQSLDQYGFGMASVRFICGTQNIHKQLEQKLSNFLDTEDTILYSSCFDANGGLFETILSAEDAVISDSLNHASIIDGVRLCKAKRFVYDNNNMVALEQCLIDADKAGARYKLIATDGVFSMDGIIANLQAICDLADQYKALVMVDDSHAVGFMGDSGRGTAEYCKVMGRIDIYTGTLGKALGGASGGYTSGKQELITWLRQRSRPYLFSNSLAPVVTATSIKVLELLESNSNLLETLRDNSRYFRAAMTNQGFNLIPGDHAIIPIMLGDAKLAAAMADELLKEGIYVIGFSFPVVPLGKARIRVQMSAALTKAHLDIAIAAFIKVGKKLNII